MIRWSFQKDYVTIPKSSNPERIKENSNIFDFVISGEDMKELVRMKFSYSMIGWLNVVIILIDRRVFHMIDVHLVQMIQLNHHGNHKCIKCGLNAVIKNRQ